MPVPKPSPQRGSRPQTRANGNGSLPAQKLGDDVTEPSEEVREESGLHLHWEGRRLYRSRVPIPRVLEPDKRLSLGTDSPNLVIEGDNLQVMVSLRSQFNAAVDICYIDPPYNRGGNDFRYSDARFHDPNADDGDANYVSNEDGGRHTKWLNYMAPRLALIYELLADDGILFASISDIELFRFGMLLDEIFDERNRIGVICWRGSADNNPTRIAIEHEYILCYAKYISEIPQVWASPLDVLKDDLMEQFEALKTEEPTPDALKRKWRALIRANKGALGRLSAYTEIDNHGPYQGARRVHNPKPGGYQYDIIHPLTKKPTKRPLNGYRYPEPKMRELIVEGRIVFGRTHDQIIQMKDYLSEYRDSLRSVIDLDSRAGINTLKALFGKNFDGFRNPKPVELIERLVGAAGGRNALVMDPFAGSGTTGHAVMRLNKQDGGDRRFILIEEGNGDDRYARTLMTPRLKKAAAKENLQGGFTFLKAGRALDREAILGLEREKIVNVVCQTDRTGTGSGIRRVQGYRYLIGANKRGEAISLCWNGRQDSDVTGTVVDQALKEVAKANLKTPMRIYGTTCRISETKSFTFCQIPDEILASLYLTPTEQSGDLNELSVT